MATSTNNDVLDALFLAKISKPNNFDSLAKDEWIWLVKEIKKDFGDKLTHEELIQVVTNGVKGKYDKTQFALNGFTIYRWIRTFLSERPKKEIPCPEGFESFYWCQMSERDQLAWIENKNKIK